MYLSGFLFCYGKWINGNTDNGYTDNGYTANKWQTNQISKLSILRLAIRMASYSTSTINSVSSWVKSSFYPLGLRSLKTWLFRKKPYWDLPLLKKLG